MATDAQLDRLLKAADPARGLDRDPTSDAALDLLARTTRSEPAGGQSVRRRPNRRRVVVAAVALLVVSGAAAIATGRFDVDPQAAADGCFAAEGFDITGRLEFSVDPHSGSLAFRPLIAGPDGSYDIRTAPAPTDGRQVSIEEREAVLVRCVEQIREELDLPAVPLPVDRELDADRATQLEACLGRAGVLEWVDDLRLLEGFDGSGLIVDYTTGPLTETQVETLNTAAASCIREAIDQTSGPDAAN